MGYNMSMSAMNKKAFAANKGNEAMGPDENELHKVFDCREDIGVLEFESRADHCLRRAGINTIGSLARQLDEVRKIRGCGENTEMEIREKLQDFINHYRPEAAASEVGSGISRRPIGHCIIMQGNIPRFLICFGACSFDMGRAKSSVSLEGTEYNLAQYRIRVTHDGRPRLYINGEAVPAVLSRL